MRPLLRLAHPSRRTSSRKCFSPSPSASKTSPPPTTIEHELETLFGDLRQIGKLRPAKIHGLRLNARHVLNGLLADGRLRRRQR